MDAKRKTPLKNNLHEIENEIDGFPENLDRHLPVHHPVFVFVWRAAVFDTVVSEDIPSHNIAGALDGVCRYSGG